MSLVGAIASSTLTILFPPVCETITFWPTGLGRFRWQFVLNVLIITFGLYIFVFGTILSVQNIYICARYGLECEN